MPSLVPSERVLAARIAAFERWGREPDRSAATAPARAGLRARFAREIEPENSLDVAERESRIDQLMRAHMMRLSLAAKSARRKAREQTAAADAAEAALGALGNAS